MDAFTVPRAVGEVYALRRVSEDGGEEYVSEHPDFERGWSAGTRKTHEEPGSAFSLYVGSRRVAKFAHNRPMPRYDAEHVSLMLGTLS